MFNLINTIKEERFDGTGTYKMSSRMSLEYDAFKMKYHSKKKLWPSLRKLQVIFI